MAGFWRVRLRPRDQAVLAVASLVFWVFLVLFLFCQPQLVDIERADADLVHFRLDINRAAWPELALLPGVGEQRAKRIVELREADGPFTSPDELLRVKGIGPKTLARVRPFLLPIPPP